MTKSIKLALVAAMAMGATSAFATNGDNLLATGTKARGMGGVGIATSFGAESSLANPALLSAIKKSEIAGSVTFFMPDVSFRSNVAQESQFPGSPSPDYVKSDADFNVIPEISFAQRINDELVYGVSLTGTAGMGVDYEDVPFGLPGDNGAFQMKTQLQLLKVAVPFSYQSGGLSVGVAPIIQHGTLKMSHRLGDGSLLKSKNSGDTSVGFEVGAAYDLKGLGAEGLTLGVVFKSRLSMEYTNTIKSSINAFGGAAQTGVASGDNLDQPAETGIGLSYTTGGSTIALDYRNVAWGDAEGYADFGWEDQNIVSVGYEYATAEWAVRLGYNYAKSAIEEQNGAANNPANYGGAVKNFFNLSGFPGIVESHITLGGSYAVNDGLTLDTAIVYSPEVTESFNTSAMTQAFIAGAGGTPSGTESSSADVKHSQLGITIGASYKF